MLDEATEYLNKNCKENYEILIVDDGSSDGTDDYALRKATQLKLAPHILRVIKLSSNRGKGGAVTHGLLHSRGRLALFADADGATKFSDVKKLMDWLNQLGNKPGVAIGSRSHMVDTDAVVKRSFIRNFLMYGLHTLVYIFGIRAIQDTQCGFKMFNQESISKVFPHMHTERWIFDVEVLLLCEIQGIAMQEVPVNWQEIDGSKIDLAKDSIGMAIDLVELSKIVESQQLGSLSEQEVISKLSERLKNSEQSKKIAEKIKQQVSDEYKERYIEELKAQVDKDYTQQIYRQLEKSYTLFQELKAKFLIDHSKEIKQSLINDILKDANDDGDGKASNLNSLISSKVDSQINKQNYLSFIFNDLIFAFKPKTESIPKMQEGDSIGGNMFREVLNPGYTKEFLTKERVELNDDVFKDLQDNHDNLVKALHNLDPPLPQFYSGDGIVINGGGVFMTGAIITLIQLRELGSKLPVEIILNDSEDYDDHICKTLLPKYNAGCKIIQQELGDELYRKLKLSSFQFKVVVVPPLKDKV
ncbi:hypothetical protein QCA50_020999 [Cerrena zonata]|uniref:dolichyl-phosphate beta-glucosyltransferase n=1 Tax=Cerrena zonata TaxID=2478898 RepID=A0AAW0FB36_9APHY